MEKEINKVTFKCTESTPEKLTIEKYVGNRLKEILKVQEDFILSNMHDEMLLKLHKTILEEIEKRNLQQ